MITRKTKIINWMIFLLLALFALIYLVPVIMMVLGSFKTQPRPVRSTFRFRQSFTRRTICMCWKRARF